MTLPVAPETDPLPVTPPAPIDSRPPADLEPRDVMAFIARRLGEGLGAGHCSHVVIDAAGERGIVEASWARDADPLSLGEVVVRGFEPSILQRLDAGKTVLVRDLADAASTPTGDVASPPLWPPAGTRALILCPLGQAQRPAEVLAVGDPQPRDWTADEVALVEQVARHARGELRNARAEARLRACEERCVLVEAAIDEGTWDWDLRSGRRYLSPRWKELLGYRPDELDGVDATDSELIHPDDRDAARRALRGHLEAGERYQVELRMRHRDGSWRWMLNRGQAVPDTAGRPQRMVGSTADITQRRQAQAVLRAEDQRLRFNDRLQQATGEVIDARDIMAVVTRELGQHLGASRCGWAQVDVVARTFTVECAYEEPGLPVSIVGTHSFDVWGEDWRRTVESGVTFVLRDVARELAGTRAVQDWAAVATQAIVCCPLVKQGRLRAIMAVDSARPRDWSADEIALIEEVVRRAGANIHRAQAEAALRASEERYALAERAVDDGIWDWDIARGQHYVSPRWKEILGYGADELEGVDPLDNELIHPDDREAARGALRQHLQDDRRYVVELRMRHRDGGWRWVLMRGRAVRDAAGRPLRMVGSTADTTTRRQAENRLRRALREKEVLLKEIYHRVKNNLQVVSSLLDLHGRNARDDSVREMLRETAERVASMALVHEQLYRDGDLSAIEFGSYARQLVAHLQDSHSRRPGALVARVEVEPVRLGIATAVPLGLLINELVSNPFKHAHPDGAGGTVTVRLERAGDGLRLGVSDDGVGLPAGFTPRNARTLGIQLVLALTEQLGGALDYSAPGLAGTRFTVSFAPDDQDRRRIATGIARIEELE